MNCFVISPIGEPDSSIRKNADEVLNDLIKPVCSENDIDVIRADEIAGPSKITDDIFEHLKQDDLVIADITGLNPNVCIELGYRMAVGKVFIIISNNKVNESPFDISHHRIISYGFSHKQFDDAKRLLNKTIQNTDFSQNNVEHHKGYTTVAGKNGTGFYFD